VIQLSVNINKVATLRNSRGGHTPSVLDATRVCVAAGSPGITVHPRADARHITERDVREVSALLRDLGGRTEFNIEGDPRPDLLALVHELRPTQCTLVPVRAGEITSQAGWPADTPRDALAAIVGPLRSSGADRVELYTEPFARAFERGPEAAHDSFRVYAAAAELAHSLGLGINAGHDLDLENLVLFRTLPHLEETSIGHALISHALVVGLDRSVREYLSVLRGA
jgi:pyridoxine 5-phosphate synthase